LCLFHCSYIDLSWFVIISWSCIRNLKKTLHMS
jgi:hypothetical protein